MRFLQRLFGRISFRYFGRTCFICMAWFYSGIFGVSFLSTISLVLFLPVVCSCIFSVFSLYCVFGHFPFLSTFAYCCNLLAFKITVNYIFLGFFFFALRFIAALVYVCVPEIRTGNIHRMMTASPILTIIGRFADHGTQIWHMISIFIWI